MTSRPAVPIAIKRHLRTEVGFCCPHCGVPILEYHHIVPWAELNVHNKDTMIAICPTCHALADNGALTASTLYNFKLNPTTNPGWNHRLCIGPGPFNIRVGNIQFNSPSSAITIEDVPVLAVGYSESGTLLLDAIFIDEKNMPIFSIKQNEFMVDSNKFWDIEFNGRDLKIKERQGSTVFEATFNSECINFKKGQFYLNGREVTFEESGVLLLTPGSFLSTHGADTVFFGDGFGITLG